MRHQYLVRLWCVLTAALLAVCLTHGSALAQVVQPKGSPTSDDIEKAKKHMAAGVSFMQDPDGARYEEAYPEFRKAYQHSGSLNALQNLAICAMKIELDGEAISYFETFLEKKGSDIEDADREQVERDLNALKAVVAWVTLSSDKAGITVDDVRTPRRGAAVRNRYAAGLQAIKLGIHPGSHVFTARSDDGKTLTWEVEIQNGSEHQHEFVFDPNAPVTAEGMPPETPQPQPDEDEDTGGGGGVHPATWAMVGVTAASAIVMAAMMGLSASKKSDYDNNIQGQAPIQEQEDAASSLKTVNVVADVFIGVTIAAAATTLVLAFTLPGDSGGDDEASNRTWTIAPAIDPRGGGAAMITGTF